MKFKTPLLVPVTLSLLLTNFVAGMRTSPRFVDVNDWVSYYETNPSSTLDSELLGPNDAFLENGYPISILHTAGSYQAGAFIDVATANLDNDPTREILISSLANGPLNVFNFDGTIRPGFPVAGGGVAYSASLDGYIASAFHGYCDPGCYSRINLYDGSGNLLWSKQTPGIGVESGPVMFKQNEQIYIAYENATGVNVVDLRGNTLNGWPRSASYNQVISAADLNGDGSTEIVVGHALGNDRGRITIFGLDGSTYSQTEPFGVQVMIYPTIGDVDRDGELEIVVIGRNTVSSYRSQMKIFNHDGSLQLSREVADNTAYGTQNSLADLDNDGYPEILFLGNDYAHVLNANGDYLPGWPKWHEEEPLYPNRSNIVVGDMIADDSNEYPEIAYTIRGSSSHFANILIYNHDGSEIERWDYSEYYRLDSGRSNSLADIDSDGYNELIIAGEYWGGTSGNYPAVWAFDLNKGQRTIAHSPVEWGGYSNDSGKSGLYIKPQY